jgi:hypothetical protein
VRRSAPVGPRGADLRVAPCVDTAIASRALSPPIADFACLCLSHLVGRMAGDDHATKDKKKERADKKREEYLDVPKKTNLGDSATIKRIMDDAVIQVSAVYPNGGLVVVAPTQPCATNAGGARRVPRGPQL